MKPVDEFKAESDQQCNKEQQVRQKGRGFGGAGGLDIRVEAVGYKEDPPGEQ
jgi:hypothetical protein